MKLISATLYDGKGLTVPDLSGFRPEPEVESQVVNVYSATRQTILGFGGAFTDSAGYNYVSMPEEEKQRTLSWLFGKEGLGYHFCRIPMASCDFSPYMYINIDENDLTFASFSIEEDKKYKIPFLKDALKYTQGNLTLFASPWSPPAFMKDTGDRLHGGRLLKKYYPLWAEYFCRFVEAYRDEGIPLWGVTLQNEPHAVQTWESCVFDAEEEIAFAKVLRAAFRAHGLETKILGWDHNKERLVERANAFLTGDDFDGIGFHWYSGAHFGAVETVRDLYPDKWMIETEFCTGIAPQHNPVAYPHDMVGNLAHGTNAIVEWNLILDEEGAPYHDRIGGCEAPVRYDTARKKAYQSPNYNATYILTHFVCPGSVALRTSAYDERLTTFACRRPDGVVVLSVVNTADLPRPLRIRCFSGHVTSLTLPPHATVTLEMEE